MCGTTEFKVVKKEAMMKKNKQCSGEVTPGCTSPVQKEGLCYKCYKKKYGHAPYEKKGAPPAKATGKGNKKINIKVHGNVADQGKFARKLASTITKATKINDRVVAVDFTNYEHLYRAIEEKARDEFRSVSGQILHMISVIAPAA